MIGLGSSLGTPSVSQGSIKCCLDKSKNRRQFLCCPKTFFRLFLVLFYFLSVISSFYQTALLSLALSQTQVFSHVPLCFGKWCMPMCR